MCGLKHQSSFERRLHSFHSVSKPHSCSFLFPFLVLTSCFSRFAPCHSPHLSYLARYHIPFQILNLSSFLVPQGLCTSHSLYLEDSFYGSLQIGLCDILRGAFPARSISHSYTPLQFHPVTLLHSCYDRMHLIRVSVCLPFKVQAPTVQR